MKGNVLFIIASIILCVTALTITLASISENPSLQPVVADVNIIPAGPTAPTIVRFANPTGVLAGPYTPLIGAITPTHFSILMEDLNGNSELPGSSTFPIVLNAPSGSNILGGMYSPLSAPDPTMARLASICLPVDCPNLLFGGGLSSGIACDIGREPLQRALVCTTNVGQTDPSGNWRFSIAIADSSSLNSLTATSLDITGLYPQTIVYNTLSAFYFGTITTAGVPTPQNFLWTGLSSTGLNQISTPVTMTNVGNTPSSASGITITGTDLKGVIITTSTLLKTAFRLSTSNGGTPPAQCTTGVQLSALAQTIPTAIVPYTQAFSLGLGTDTDIIYACIPNTLISSITGATDTQYKTTPGQAWVVTA